MEGLKGEQSISEICRREGITSSLYYRWSKAFLEAGKKRLKGDTEREATTAEDAIRSTGVARARVVNRPRLLSDNEPACLSGELREYLESRGIGHTRSKPFHPMTQGKIERYHRSMKSVIRLDNYYSPEALQREITSFVRYYNNERYHEALDNVTPADVYFGRAREVIARREKIKRQTMNERRRLYKKAIAAGA